MNKKQIEFMQNSTVAQQFTHKIDIEAKRDKIRLYAPLVLLIVLTLIAGIFIDSFFSPKNIINLLYQMSIPLVLATGVTFVLLIGSIDLSVEGVMGFSGAVVALLVTNSMNNLNIGGFGIILTLIVGTAFGVLTGFLHVKLRIASFIITYAMGSIITGFGILSYGGTPSRVLWPIFDIIAQETFLQIPILTWISLGIFGLGCIVLNFTAFGKAVYAIGDNEGAARSTGINVNKIKIMVFAFCAFTASCAGILSVIRLKLGQVSIGTNQLFPVITSIVLGGASLSGGKGGMVQTLIGVLIFTELNNILTILAVDPNYKQLIQGVIIIVAVTLTITRSRQTITK